MNRVFVAARRTATAALLAWVVLPSVEASTFDLAILDGHVITGLEGGIPVEADVGIVGTDIIRVGEIEEGEARQVIDARGLYVVPGFIDVHTHADIDIEDYRQAGNYLLQGVTTVLGGNCGGSNLPLETFLGRLERSGVGVNLGSLVGHGAIREQVMGSRREPRRSDMARMRTLVRGEMEGGAFGLSTGLVYRPGVYANTDELIDLASVVAEYGGLYVSHIRSEGRDVREAVEEAIRIGEANGMGVHISHIKLGSRSVHGRPELISEPVLDALARGVDVTTDQYPYTASPASLWGEIPAWAWGNGHEDFLAFLEDPSSYQALEDYYVDSGIAEELLDAISIGQSPGHRDCEGLTLREILTLWGWEHTARDAARAIIELQRGGFVVVFYFGLRQADVDSLAVLPFNMIASDSIAVSIEAEGIPHPRNFGTFPRVVRMFVKEKMILTLGEAIHKMTGLPARTFGLADRGVVEAGYRADLVVFDLERIRDNATYSEAAHPSGISCVVVNGQIAARDGELTDVLAGEVLYGPGRVRALGW